MKSGNIFFIKCFSFWAAAFGLAAPLSANVTNTWVGAVNDWDWDKAGNFEKGKPNDGDEVWLPEGCKVYVTNDASYEVVNRLKRIRPLAKNVEIVFNVPPDAEKSVACAINYAGANADHGYSRWGAVRKQGGGTLILESNQADYKKTGTRDYIVHLIVEAGILKMSQDRGADSSQSCVVGCLSISNNAAFYLPDSSNTFRCFGLFGESESLITNALAQNVDFDVATTDRGAAEASVFAGRMGGQIRYESQGRVMLTGTQNTQKYTGSTAAFSVFGNNGAGEGGKGVVGVLKFGNNGEISSIGRDTLPMATRTGGGGFLYLGSGEETNRGIQLWDSSRGPSFLDAGAAGALVWKGNLTTSSDSEKQHLFVLTGSNAVPCSWSGTVQYRENNGGCSVHITKRGTGTWHLKSAASGMRGGWSVENGVLRFDSLAERGTDCALGKSDILLGPVCASPDSAPQIPHAFILGSSATEGTLDYQGAKDVVCTTRPILLNGAGRIVNSTDAGFVFSGVSSADGISGRLALDGDNAASANLIENVYDGKGITSLAKDGAGVWVLDNSSARDFSGDLVVNKGTLKVRSHYTWYKWTIRKNDAAENNGNLESYIQAYAFSLYDKSGIRQNWELKQVSSAALLKPGEVAFDALCTVENYNSTTRLTNLFTHAISRWTCKPTMNGSPVAVVPNDESTHVSVVMRLPASSAPIASYDWGYSRVNPRRRIISYTLFGSADGSEWQKLDEVDDIGSVSDMCWYFAATGATMDNISPHTGGKEISTAHQSSLNAMVSVANGATLESVGAKLKVSRIRVDALGAGTMRNLSFAGSGEIDVVNHFDGMRFLPGAYEDCEGLENLENYAVSFNGIPNRRVHIKVADGKVAVLKTGFVFVVK